MLRLEAGEIAHGGHVVARHEGQVVFVRHALPGELVEAVITKGAPGDRYVFADAVRVLRASPHRVPPRCPVAGPGGCGGCDFQHAALGYQRELKAHVVSAQLRRLGGVACQVTVEAVPGDEEGLRWRTRMELAVDRAGRAGLRRHRSREVIPLRDCPIAVGQVAATGVFRRRWPGSRQVEVVVPGQGEPQVVPVPGGVRRAGLVTQPVTVPAAGQWPQWTGRFEVPVRGFWQVHPGAAAALAEAVLAAADPQPGQYCLDLYAGAGLFAAALAARVGPGGRVVAVESDPRSVRAARAMFAAGSQVRVIRGRVADVLRGRAAGVPDGAGGAGEAGEPAIVVLDPPRAGAGAEVITAIAALRPQVVVYVACDPAALARDVATARSAGYRLDQVRAFDLFPMTHHVECVAVFRPDQAGGPAREQATGRG